MSLSIGREGSLPPGPGAPSGQADRCSAAQAHKPSIRDGEGGQGAGEGDRQQTERQRQREREGKRERDHSAGK